MSSGYPGQAFANQPPNSGFGNHPGAYGPGQGQPGGYPPQGQGQPGGYPPQGQGQPGGYPPQGQGQQAGYPPPGHPPQQGYNGQQGGGYPQQGQWQQPNYQQPQQHGQFPPPTSPYAGGFASPQAGPYGQPPQGQHAQPPSYPTQASPGYNPSIVTQVDMTAAANEAYSAMKGFGTNEKKLTRSIAKLDPLQIAALRKTYQSRYKDELATKIKDETSGDYREALLSIVRGPLQQDVECVYNAVKGFGTKEVVLTDVLAGRSNADMQAIKEEYKKAHKKKMVDVVKSDLSSLTEDHFTLIMEASRNEESASASPEDIESDVGVLYAATEGKVGTAEKLVYTIFTKRSDGQLRAISHRYQQKYMKPLENVIRSEFSGHMRMTLLLQLSRATDRAMSDAVQIDEAMKGMGTNEKLLTQRIVRCHWNPDLLDQVKKAYKHKYKTDLIRRVEGETKGDYEDVLRECLK